MAKFTNKTASDTINYFLDSAQQQINNPYFAATNLKNSLECTFFNPNREQSTLDEDSKLSYSSHGDESPIKYDKYYKMPLFELDTIEAKMENGDFGLESDIQGECVILPNILVPIPGAFFYIDRYKDIGIFKVVDANPDTAENGANYWNITYTLDRKDITIVDDQVVNEYNIIVDNSGDATLSPVIKKEDYEYAKELSSVLEDLCEYYKNLFYSSRVDTFILEYDSNRIYDPFLIEFIKKNKLMNNLSKYMCIYHQTSLPSTFSLEYSSTIFRAIEKRKIKNNVSYTCICRGVDEPLSILSMRNEEYLQMVYINNFTKQNESIRDFKIDTFSPMFINNCINNNKEEKDKYLNIIIKYFNNEDITKDDLLYLDDINYAPTKDLFYILPLIIYILNTTMYGLMS